MVQTTAEARAYRQQIERLVAYAPEEEAIKIPTAYPVWSGDSISYSAGDDDPGSGIVLQYLPSELVGVYFEEVA